MALDFTTLHKSAGMKMYRLLQRFGRKHKIEDMDYLLAGILREVEYGSARLSIEGKRMRILGDRGTTMSPDKMFDTPMVCGELGVNLFLILSQQPGAENLRILRYNVKNSEEYGYHFAVLRLHEGKDPEIIDPLQHLLGTIRFNDDGFLFMPKKGLPKKGTKKYLGRIEKACTYKTPVDIMDRDQIIRHVNFMNSPAGMFYFYADGQKLLEEDVPFSEASVVHSARTLEERLLLNVTLYPPGPLATHAMTVQRELYHEGAEMRHSDRILLHSRLDHVIPAEVFCTVTLPDYQVKTHPIPDSGKKGMCSISFLRMLTHEKQQELDDLVLDNMLDVLTSAAIMKKEYEEMSITLLDRIWDDVGFRLGGPNLEFTQLSARKVISTLQDVLREALPEELVDNKYHVTLSYELMSHLDSVKQKSAGGDHYDSALTNLILGVSLRSEQAHEKHSLDSYKSTYQHMNHLIDRAAKLAEIEVAKEGVCSGDDTKRLLACEYILRKLYKERSIPFTKPFRKFRHDEDIAPAVLRHLSCYGNLIQTSLDSLDRSPHFRRLADEYRSAYELMHEADGEFDDY